MNFACCGRCRRAELHPRLGLGDGLVELAYEEVDVIASPVAQVGDSVGHGAELFFVGYGLACHGVGIEIVVDVESVDVISPDDVGGHAADILTVLRQSGVEDILSVIFKDPFGMCL